MALAAALAPAADLPPHRPLRIVVVSDEVNPHGLPGASLTQPGEISAALLGPGTELNLDSAPGSVVEIATNDIEQATALLSLPAGDPAAYDVLIYFAHRIPNNGNDATGRQAAFTAAVDAFLVSGGGVVSFHHGVYLTGGKEGILDLIGATATGGVPWDTVNGQNVIAAAPRSFVACQGVEYDGSVAYADAARGVPAGTYPLFNNTPDERYPFMEYNASALGNVQTLFGSDYNDNGTTHLLGWVHRRPAWAGRVVGYQPGEYQPNALDDVDGNNLQILLNAVLYAAGEIPADQLRLTASKTGLANEVALVWTGCENGYALHRSTSPQDVEAPARQIASPAGNAWNDLPPAGAIHYYKVLAAP